MNTLQKNSGFTLLEVLVSLGILLFGLLGIAGLMVKGQHASYEAYQRQQALALASDMAERITNNRSVAPNYLTVGGPLGGGATPAIVFCSPATIPCSAAVIAASDIAAWTAMLNGASESSATNGLVGGLVNARGCVTWIGAAAAPVYNIEVTWQGATNTGAGSASACAAAVYAPGMRRVVNVQLAL
jgi:type IV pilus assembly protein PilV